MLEPLARNPRDHDPPRANLLARPGELAGPGIWMGGAHTPIGLPIEINGVERSWVIDCAGDMPGSYRARAARWFARVFPDLDAIPSDFDGIRALATDVAAAMASSREAPDNLYVVCQHGMNRSGLVAGLVLRQLGVPGPEALARITAARPGALSNQAFRRLVEGRPVVSTAPDR